MAILLGSFGLASCALLEPDAPPPAEEVAQQEPPPAPIEPPPPRPAKKPAPPVTVARLSPGTTDQPPPPVDPDHIKGLDEAAATAWLGEPAAKTEAPPATIWRFASRDCEVDVYFYLDLQNRVMRALHYEVRGNDSAERRPERCFQQLVDEHRQRDGSTTAYSPR